MHLAIIGVSVGAGLAVFLALALAWKGYDILTKPINYIRSK